MPRSRRAGHFRAEGASFALGAALLFSGVTRRPPLGARAGATTFLSFDRRADSYSGRADVTWCCAFLYWRDAACATCLSGDEHMALAPPPHAALLRASPSCCTCRPSARWRLRDWRAGIFFGGVLTNRGGVWDTLSSSCLKRGSQRRPIVDHLVVARRCGGGWTWTGRKDGGRRGRERHADGCRNGMPRVGRTGVTATVVPAVDSTIHFCCSIRHARRGMQRCSLKHTTHLFWRYRRLRYILPAYADCCILFLVCWPRRVLRHRCICSCHHRRNICLRIAAPPSAAYGRACDTAPATRSFQRLFFHLPWLAFSVYYVPFIAQTTTGPSLYSVYLAGLTRPLLSSVHLPPTLTSSSLFWVTPGVSKFRARNAAAATFCFDINTGWLPAMQPATGSHPLPRLFMLFQLPPQ